MPKLQDSEVLEIIKGAHFASAAGISMYQRLHLYLKSKGS